MSRKTHQEYFLDMVDLVAERSTCGRRKVGAIITDVYGHILSTGYNGVPRNFPHCIEIACPGRYDSHGNTGRCFAIHAEANALLQCHRIDLAHTMYVSCSPCFECAKMIANTNIKEIYSKELYTKEGAELLADAGIKLLVAKS